jgi:cell division protein FtsW
MRVTSLAARPERVILAIVLGISAFGLVMVYSASSILGMAQANSPSLFFEAQLPKLIAGLILLACFWHFDYHHFGRKVTLGMMAIVLASLAFLVFLNGFRWYKFLGFTVQPSEFARVCLAVFLASYLSRKEREIEKNPRVLWIPAVAILATAGLVALQPSLSMAVLIYMLGLLMLYLNGVKKRWLIIGTAVIAIAALPVVMRDYQMNRIRDILGMGTSESSWQREQSITAVGSGGVLGMGLGKGLQKYFFLPFPHTDFILGIVGEETGLVGMSLLLAAYAVLILMGIATARRAPDRFGSLLAAGLTLNLALNVVVHTVVNLGVGPVTGVPLPFMSCGGSSLMANLLAVGILMSVAKRSLAARARDWSSIGGIRG